MNTTLDTRGRNFKWLIYLVDIIILVAVFSIFVNFIVEANGWRNYDSDSRFYWNRYGHVFVFILSYIFAVNTVKIKPKDLDSMLETFMRAAAQIIVMYVFFTFSVWVLFHTFPGHLLLWSGLVNGILICLAHCTITKLIVNRRRQNAIDVVFVGTDSNVSKVSEVLKNGYSTFSYNVLGFFTENEGDAVPPSETRLGCVSDVIAFLENNHVSAVYCSVPPEDSRDIIKACEDRFISFYYVPNIGGYLHRKMHFTQYDDVTLISLHNEPLSDPYNRFKKRLMDVVISGLFLVTIFPLVFIFVAIGTKLSSPGPVFFRQKRTGYQGKSFMMLKFRSMKVNADADRLQATSDDPRKTKFGDFLRRTSIDELPQFINVFKGDMSIIGPRPHMEYHTEMYTKLVDEYLVRHMVKPGLTGWAQVNGCRGETKTVEQMADRVRHDIWYIENWSMVLDFRIFAKTVMQIFKGDEQAY